MSATANGSGLAQRVAALEQQVALLAAASQGEALQPNYLTVNPDGSTGALFAGGAQLNEQAVQTYGPSTSLGWLSGAGQIAEFITGVFSGGAHALYLQTQPDANDYALIDLTAIAAGGQGSASVAVIVRDNAGTIKNLVLLDSLGRSNFLQLPSTKQQAHDSGSVVATWAGGSTQSGVQPVTHALTHVPSSITVATLVSNNGFTNYGQIVNGSVTSSGFSLFAISTSGNPANLDGTRIYWMADG